MVKFEFRLPPRSGEQVAVLENLHKSFGPRVIYDGFNLTIRRGERWAVMCRNGAGKTTLLKMIAGASAPDAGSVRLGASLYMGYFAQQSLDILNPDLTVIEQLQQDGRRPYTQMAPAVGLSEAAVRQRVQRLIDAGVMQIVAVTDPRVMGYPRQAMIGIKVTGDTRTVADQISALSEVEYVVLTAGSHDILVEVVVEDDEHGLLGVRPGRPANFARIEESAP